MLHSQFTHASTNDRIPSRQVAGIRSVTTVHASPMSSMLRPLHPTVPRAPARNMLPASSAYINMISTSSNSQTYDIHSMPPAAGVVNNTTSNLVVRHHPPGVMYPPLANPQTPYAVQLTPAAQRSVFMHAAFEGPQYPGHVNAVPASGYGSNMFSDSPLPHPFSAQGFMPVQVHQASRMDPASSASQVHDPAQSLPHRSIPLTTQRPQPPDQDCEDAPLIDSLASQRDMMLENLLSMGRSRVRPVNEKPVNGTIMDRKPAADQRGPHTRLVYTLELYPTMYEEFCQRGFTVNNSDGFRDLENKYTKIVIHANGTKTHTTHPTFKPFRKLPHELKLMIFEMHMKQEEPRVVKIQVRRQFVGPRPNCFAFDPMTPVASMFLVNQMTRSMAKKVYKKWFRYTTPEGEYRYSYIHPEKDIPLLLPGKGFVGPKESDAKILKLSITSLLLRDNVTSKSLERLAVPIAAPGSRSNPLWREYTAQALAKLPKVKELTLLVHSDPGEFGLLRLKVEMLMADRAAGVQRAEPIKIPPNFLLRQ